MEGLNVLGVSHLRELLAFLAGKGSLRAAEKPTSPLLPDPREQPDFRDIPGQERVKRALEIAAAGGHPILLYGSPGVGKTMLARRLPTILPPMTPTEILETTRIHSLSTAGPLTALVTHRPFRNPHHTANDIALTGGGSSPQPGEISVEVESVPLGQLMALSQPVESSAVIRARVVKARAVQSERFTGLNGVYSNARMPEQHPDEYCLLDTHARRYLFGRLDSALISVRSYSRILKVSRTIADLAGSEAVEEDHVAEAVQFRGLERMVEERKKVKAATNG